MPYGALPAKRRLPKQDHALIARLGEWWAIAALAQSKWATEAKECLDFREGIQYAPEDIAALERQNRPHFQFNKIDPLLRLIQGYQSNNETDIRIRAGKDGVGTNDVAELLTKLIKQISIDNDLDDVDAEVFNLGMSTGRGYWDHRLDFANNDLGEIRTISEDPFSCYPDPDCTGYDLNTGQRVHVSKWLSLDEIEYIYGRAVKDAVSPYTMQGSQWAGFPTYYYDGSQEVYVRRGFAEEEEIEYSTFRQLFHTSFVDTTRKNVRVIETQYYLYEEQRVFIDQETGDKSIIPAEWNQARIQKALAYAEAINNPLDVQSRIVRTLHWSTIVGDVLVYDRLSPYKTFTLVGFFPYFRDGITRGMVHDLRDPQREINKRRNAQIESVAKTANGGWLYHEGSFDTVQERNLKQFGSSPGVNLKWSGTSPHQKPEQIAAQPPNVAMERLEEAARNDLRDISGFNEAALGELDKVESGRALEARQRQSIIAVQPYLTNFSRSKKINGRKYLIIIQQHYTEERIYRIVDDDAGEEILHLNQSIIDPTTMAVQRLNDVTLGNYSVIVDEQPMATTFRAAQFDEALLILERLSRGMAPDQLALFADILVDMSSLPRKEELKERIQAVLAASGIPIQGALGGPGQQMMLPPGAGGTQPQQLLPPGYGGNGEVIQFPGAAQ